MYEYGYPPQILKLGQMVIWYVCFVTIISLDDLMTSCRVFVLCEVDDWRMMGNYAYQVPSACPAYNCMRYRYAQVLSCSHMCSRIIRDSTKILSTKMTYLRFSMT